MTTFRLIKDIHSVLGSKHQGNLRHGSANQCVAMAATSIARSSRMPLSRWTSEEIDENLFNGDELFRNVSSDGDFLSVCDVLEIPIPVDRDYLYLEMDTRSTSPTNLSGLLNFDCLSKSLHEFARLGFTYAICVGGDIAVAIIREGDSFWISDSHERGNFGIRVDRMSFGAACIKKFSLSRFEIDAANDFLINCTIRRPEADQFHVFPIKIRDLPEVTIPAVVQKFVDVHSPLKDQSKVTSLPPEKTSCIICGVSKDKYFRSLTASAAFNHFKTVGEAFEQIKLFFGTLKNKDGTQICQNCYQNVLKAHKQMNHRQVAMNELNVIICKLAINDPMRCVNCNQLSLSHSLITYKIKHSAIALVSVLYAIRNSVQAPTGNSTVLCFNCVQLLTKLHRINVALLSLQQQDDVPVSTQPDSEILGGQKHRLSPGETSSSAKYPMLCRSRYFDEDFMTNFRYEIQNEVAKFNTNFNLKAYRFPSIQQIANLNFEELERCLRQNCPLISTILSNIASEKPDDRKLDIIIIMAFCSLLYARSTTYCLIQRIIGFQLWRGGLSSQVIRSLNHLGISMSPLSITNLADQFVKDGDDRLQNWKKMIESAASACTDIVDMSKEEVHITSHTDSEVSSSSIEHQRKMIRARRSLNFSVESHMPPTFSYCYDNLNKNVDQSLHGPSRQSKTITATTGYIVRNRVPFKPDQLEAKVTASSLPMSTFLMNDGDKTERFIERCVVLKEIACKNIKYFNDARFQKCVPARISTHVELSRKSEFIPAGLIYENETSIKGCIRVMEVFDKHTPVVNNVKTEVIVYGDGATVNTLTGAKIARSWSVDSLNSFNHVHAAFGDFHRRMLLMNNHFKKFKISVASQASLGSLANMLIKMRHKEAIREDFNRRYDATMLFMEGMGTLLLMEIMGLEDQDDTPVDAPNESSENYEEYFDTVIVKAAKIIEFQVFPIDASPETPVCECEDYGFDKFTCVGLSDSAHLLICENLSCDAGRYFHKTCCSSRFESVRAASPSHRSYCSIECSDQVFRYSCLFLDSAMTQYLRKVHIRAMTGAVSRHIKEDFHEFFLSNANPNYLKFAYRFLASQAGFSSSLIAHDERFNRTINTSGRPCRNCELDLHCEHLVKDCKCEICKIAGDPTIEAIDRRTKVFVQADIIETKLNEFTNIAKQQGHVHKKDIRADVREFVSAYIHCKLFKPHQTRAHSDSETLYYQVYVPSSSTQFSAKITKLADNFDFERHVCELFRNDETTVNRLKDPVQPAQTVSLPASSTSWAYTFNKWILFKPLEFLSLHFPSLPKPNDHQLVVAQSLEEGRDVVCLLPTGFGKTLSYIYPAIIRMEKQRSTIMSPVVSVIVSPLTALITDQVRVLTEYGLRAIHLRADNLEDTEIFVVNSKEVPVYLYCSPETLKSHRMRVYLESMNPQFLIVDEAHLIFDWGFDFRMDLAVLGELRSFFTSPVGAFTATCNSASLLTIHEQLCLQENFRLFNYIPDRPNIYLAQPPARQRQKFFRSLCDGLRVHKQLFPKTIIFVSTYVESNKVFKELVLNLKGECFTGNDNTPNSSLIACYNSEQTEANKSYVYESFLKTDSHIRVLIATSAFSMGINIPDIKICVHPFQPSSYGIMWQQIGRIGRDGHQALSVSFTQPKSFSFEESSTDDESQLESRKTARENQCYRKTLLEDFTFKRSKSINFTTENSHPCDLHCPLNKCMCKFCRCCDMCQKNECKCTGKGNMIANFLQNFS